MNSNESSLAFLSSDETPRAPLVPVAQVSGTRTTRRTLSSTTQRAVVLLAELSLAALSFSLSVLVLHDGQKWSLAASMSILPIVLAFRLVGIYSVGLFRSSLRYASLHDLLNITKAATLSSILIYVVVRRIGPSDGFPPLGFYVLDWALFQFFLGGLHFGARIYRSHLAIGRRSGKRVVIMGAGDAGMTVLKELTSDSKSTCRPVAILDDNPQMRGSTICGVPVAGGTYDLAKVARATAADEVLICIPSATRSEMSRMLSACCQSNLPVRTLPTLAEIIDGTVSQHDLRNVQIEDLLQREELPPDLKEISEIVGGKVVLVTGAGGSIGSELSRQVAAAEPRVLLLLEKTENSLFYIHRELHERFPSLQIKPLLIDVTLRNLVDEMFHRERPEVVFHAAAHKHVGLLELHPAEAVRNNVLGTRNVATAAIHSGTSRFVNISTDKAVNPESYMGLSKRLTELCIQELATWNVTRFMNVRFGNVAGSNGSVLRLFWDQIQSGKPLQVTDPRATRYFMSIPEAVYLILRAAGQGRGGETFIFEMGDPINIYELAKSLSLLAGLAPGKEVPIHFTGLREGEKVNEELWEEWEHPMPTSQKGVLMMMDRHPQAAGILEKIDNLESYLLAGDRKGLFEYLGEIMPDFAANRLRSFPVEVETPKPSKAISQGVSMKVPLSKPDIGELEIQYVTEVLRKGKLSLGPRLGEFEEKFAAYVGTRYAIATNSGTSALHLCVRSLGIGPQDEVITTPFSFVASTNCILYEGALPVFVDIDPVTLNIDPKQLRRFLRQCCTLDTKRGALMDKATGRTVKAILPVHVFGLPCDMDPIMELARQYGLTVIEDACEALGGEYRGRRVGTFGDAAAFAFYPNKQMTTAEGGMIVTDNEDVARLCRSLRNQGRDEDSSWLRHVRLGYNYRLSDIHCALGLAQLERIDELLQARERNAARYNKALAGNPYLTLPSEFDGIQRSWFVFVVQMNSPAAKADRDRVLLKLREQGIECQAYFPAIHRQAYLSGNARAPLGPLFRTESASDRCIALPFFSTESEEQIEFVSETLARILEETLAPTAQTPRVFTAAASLPQ
jgi:FlaA1/EpsC-like NDP-sugar epimerase/dTDP-4-amino-4,6-dideoxygalactose transaminase